MASRVAIALAGSLALAVPARAARAQGGPIARTFELRARPGVEAQLDEGYRRHLDWHVRAGDRRAWYLWEVADGERAGLYVDGIFGHGWADFDAVVDPSGDGADNLLNVEPFATRAANHVWRLRPELGGGAVDVEGGPLVWRMEYQVRPGAEAAFERALLGLRAQLGARPYAVFELVSGGDPATFVLWIPAAGWAQLGAAADDGARGLRALGTHAERARAELWRFRADLSSCRRASSRCHATLP